VWDVETGACILKLQGHTKFVNSARFSSDNSLVISASGDQTVRVWEIQTGKCIKVVDCNKSTINSAELILE